MKRTRWLIPVFFLALALLISSGAAAAPEADIFLPMVSRPLPQLGPIAGPLLVDGEAGRIYTQAEVEGVSRTVVLSSSAGQLLHVFEPVGRLALDRTRQRLLVDQGDDGVIVLEAGSGTPTGTLSLPGRAAAAPQVDPLTGIGYVFREYTIHMIDPAGPSVLRSVPIALSLSVCGEEQGAAPITHSYYDLLADTLYVSATTAVCTPLLYDTIVAFDSRLVQEAAYQFSHNFQAVPFAGNLYGSSVLTGYQPFGLSYWALDASDKWFSETNVGTDAALKGIAVDSARNYLYEAIWEYPSVGPAQKMVRVSRTGDRELLHTVPWEELGLHDALLAGHDPKSDQLYFLEAGKLRILPISVLVPES